MLKKLQRNFIVFIKSSKSHTSLFENMAFIYNKTKHFNSLIT